MAACPSRKRNKSIIQETQKLILSFFFTSYQVGCFFFAPNTTMHYLRAMVIEYAEEGRFKTVMTNSPEEEAKVVEEGWILVRAFEGTTKAPYKKHIET